MGHALRRRLHGFVRHQREQVSEWLEQEFTWPPHLLALARLAVFDNFRWVCVRGVSQAWIMGIRRLGNPPVLCARVFEAAGFIMQPVGRAESLPRSEGISEDYLIAELSSSASVSLFGCLFAPPDIWQVLETYVVTRTGTPQAH